MSIRQWVTVAIVCVMLFALMVSGASASGVNASTVFQSPVPVRTASLAVTGVTVGTPRVGQQFATEMQFTINVTSGPGMTGAEVYMSYDPLFVDPVSQPGVTGNAVMVPDFFGASNLTVNELVANCQPLLPGRPCLHIVVAGPAQYNKTGVALRFYWLGKQTGTAVFQILNPVTSLPPVAEPRTAFVDADGYLIALSTVSAAPVPILPRLGSISGTVIRQGVPPTSGGGTQACTTVSAGTVTTRTAVNGAFRIENLPLGTYTVQAVYPGYVSAQKTNVTLTDAVPDVNLAQVRLRGGDVVVVTGDVQDNLVNILDIGRIIGMFGRLVPIGSLSAACTVADTSTDINDDGVVNISDLAIAAGNWSLVGPTVWP